MFKALLKKQLREFFVGITTGKKSASAKKFGKAGFIALYALCFISLCAAFFGMSSMFMDAILPTGQLWLYYSLMCITGTAFAVIGSAFSAYTSLYNAKDNDLLLSLPIPSVYILIVRMITIFVLGMMFECVVLLPSMVQYWIAVKATFMSVIAPIIVMFALGFIALGLSCVLGWLVGLIASKVKNKNTATVIFTLLFIAAYYVFYFNIQKILANLVANIGNMKFALHLFGDACTGKVLPLIIVVVLAAGVFVLTCLVLSRSFIKIVTRNNAVKKVEYKQTAVQTAQSLKKSLLQREIQHFKGSAVYMLNCGLGIILMPLAGVILLIKAKAITPLLPLLPEGLLVVLIYAAVITVAAMNAITCPSISLEGRSFWITRSLPIKAYDVLEAKLKLHYLFTIPPALLMGLLVGIGMGLEVNEMVLLLAPIYVTIIVQAQIGLILNLKMPNLDWTNEAVPVKRSLPVVIDMFGSWALAVAIAGGYFLLRNLLDASTYLIVVMIVFAMISRFLGKWLRTKGVEVYETI